MKALYTLLALAATTFVNALEPRWHPQTSTMTTYTTTTVCPATTTTTAGGVTKIITTLQTSTITVTACVNCETTVPGPTTTE